MEYQSDYQNVEMGSWKVWLLSSGVAQASFVSKWSSNFLNCSKDFRKQIWKIDEKMGVDWWWYIHTSFKKRGNWLLPDKRFDCFFCQLLGSKIQLYSQNHLWFKFRRTSTPLVFFVKSKCESFWTTYFFFFNLSFLSRPLIFVKLCVRLFGTMTFKSFCNFPWKRTPN